jgi:hypothetical protein
MTFPTGSVVLTGSTHSDGGAAPALLMTDGTES